MANNLLGISIAGLRVSQAGLSTVGHNIANSDTDGYSRQRVNSSANPATLGPGGYFGNGARVESIDRIVNGFVVEQVRTDTTLFSGLDSYYNQLRQLDNLLSNESTGLSGSLNDFFSALHGGADDPTSLPARQAIINETENLSNRFNALYERMQLIESGVESSMNVAVSEINSLADNIALLNLKIAEASGSGRSPNDLLDQRDSALKALSALVPVQAYDQGGGQVNVSIGNGQSLVVGAEARKLLLETSTKDGAKLDVMFHDGSRKESVSSAIAGGELGGLLRFRDQDLSVTYNELGRIALVIADAFNQTHQQGVDLDNEFGGLFFNDINDPGLAKNRVVGSASNAMPNDREMALYIRDAQQLTASDYRVTIEGSGSYRIVRASDNSEVASGLMPGKLPLTVSFDGMELEFERGSFRGGDSFILQPTRAGAQDIQSILSDPESLAFASPILTDASINNKGSGKISAGDVVSLHDTNGNLLPMFSSAGGMDPPLVVVFTSPNRYDVMDNSDPGNPVQLEPPIRNQRYLPNTSNPLFSEDPGQTIVSTQGSLIGLPEGRSAVMQDISQSPAEHSGNGYPAEAITITRAAATHGGQEVKSNVFTQLNASARATASALNSVPGVQANAFTTAELSDLQVTKTSPLQLHLNGEALVEYDAAGTALVSNVPDPATDPEAFYDYIASRINSNSALQSSGIHAVAGTDAVTGEPVLRVHANEGDDLNFALTAANNEGLAISDGEKSPSTLRGTGSTERAQIVVGGRLDVTLGDGMALSTYPPVSMLFGDTRADDFAQDTYRGLQVSISGSPAVGDVFSLEMNTDGTSDNRNALNLIDLKNAKKMAGGLQSVTQGYGSLIEKIGTGTRTAKVNREAAEQVLHQSEDLRNSISGVNLDEEAADLIRFEQLFSANAQVISVARDIFDRLINSL